MGQNHTAFVERVRALYAVKARKGLIACARDKVLPRPVTFSEAAQVSMTGKGEGRGLAIYPEELILMACADGMSTEHLVFRR